MNEIEKLEKKLDELYRYLYYAKERAYGVGKGRVVNPKGSVGKQDVAKVRAVALEDVKKYQAEIDEVYAKLIQLSA